MFLTTVKDLVTSDRDLRPPPPYKPSATTKGEQNRAFAKRAKKKHDKTGNPVVVIDCPAMCHSVHALLAVAIPANAIIVVGLHPSEVASGLWRQSRRDARFLDVRVAGRRNLSFYSFGWHVRERRTTTQPSRRRCVCRLHEHTQRYKQFRKHRSFMSTHGRNHRIVDWRCRHRRWCRVCHNESATERRRCSSKNDERVCVPRRYKHRVWPLPSEQRINEHGFDKVCVSHLTQQIATAYDAQVARLFVLSQNIGTILCFFRGRNSMPFSWAAL